MLKILWGECLGQLVILLCNSSKFSKLAQAAKCKAQVCVDNMLGDVCGIGVFGVEVAHYITSVNN